MESILYCGRLHGDEVADAGFPIEPLGGRHLAARSERDEQAVADIALGKPDLAGLIAIDVDVDFGPIDHLVNVDVGGAGDTRDLLADLPRDLVIAGRVAADHLHVDGRGQAEVQNLVGDVGGFEEERHVGKPLVQALAQLIGVSRGGPVFFRIQRDQDVAIAGVRWWGCRRRPG